jgi:transcriptional regulator with XRE-family HTH domain
MSQRPTLAQFLRARRDLVQPAEVGLTAGGRRRVAGLRREEVAVLAHISTDYYLRLEQGREEHPSDDVLDAIAQALKLDDDAAAYLHNLVRQNSAQRRGESFREVHPELAALIDGWRLTVAYVCDPNLDVVLANSLAEKVSPHFRVGVNPMRALFLEPTMRDLFWDWQILTAWAVPYMRGLVGKRPSPALLALIDELNAGSPRFQELWSRGDVNELAAGPTKINHPQFGSLNLYFQQLELSGTGHAIVAYWAKAGSATERKLRLLERN